MRGQISLSIKILYYKLFFALAENIIINILRFKKDKELLNKTNEHAGAVDCVQSVLAGGIAWSFGTGA